MSKFKKGDKFLVKLSDDGCFFGDYYNGDTGTITDVFKLKNESVTYVANLYGKSIVSGKNRHGYSILESELVPLTKLHKALL